jgi:hypothetical protein
MKKIMFVSLFSILFLLIIPTNSIASSDKEILSDAFLTTLYPHIDNAVAGFYGELTQSSPVDAEIISITQPKEGIFAFNVVVKIRPFEKAHIYIGTDTVTMYVDTRGVRVIEYSHEEVKY